MEQLEFALIPTGIVLGYGVTKILGSWGHVIHIWDRLERPPLIFLSSTALCLYLMYSNFAGLWAYRGVDFELTQGIFNVIYLFALTLPMLLFMLAVSVLVPPNMSETSDLEAHFFESALAFNLIFAAAVGASLLTDLLPGVKFAPQPIPGLIAMTVIILVGLARSRALHLSMHAALWLLFTVWNVFLVYEGA